MGVKFQSVKVNRYCQLCCYNGTTAEDVEKCFNAGPDGKDECKFGRVGYYKEEVEDGYYSRNCGT